MPQKLHISLKGGFFATYSDEITWAYYYSISQFCVVDKAMAAALYKTAGASRSINREDEDVDNIEVIPLHFAKEFSV